MVRAWIPHTLGTSYPYFPSSASFCAPPAPSRSDRPPHMEQMGPGGTWGQGLLLQELLEKPSTLQIRVWGKRCF